MTALFSKPRLEAREGLHGNPKRRARNSISCHTDEQKVTPDNLPDIKIRSANTAIPHYAQPTMGETESLIN